MEENENSNADGLSVQASNGLRLRYKEYEDPRSPYAAALHIGDRTWFLERDTGHWSRPYGPDEPL